VVKHLPNETVRFEEGEISSSNVLVRAVQMGHPVWRFKIESIVARVLNRGKLSLHSL